MEMESAKQPVLNIYPPMRWVRYENGVMILQVLTSVGEGKSAWLNVPTVDASSVYLQKSEPVSVNLGGSAEVKAEKGTFSLDEAKADKKSKFWGRKK
jgi:hypothetical protein